MNIRMIWAIPAILTGFVIAPASGADFAANARFAQSSMQKADTTDGIRQLLPPGSPVPKIGPHATQLEYIQWAKNSLSRGQNAEAELSLEWAQLRSRVDENESAFAAGALPLPYDNLCERALCKALRSIGRGDASSGMIAINDAIIVAKHETLADMQTASR